MANAVKDTTANAIRWNEERRAMAQSKGNTADAARYTSNIERLKAQSRGQ